MTNFDEKLDRLSERLEKMVEYQEYFYREINQLREEIKLIKQAPPNPSAESIYQPPSSKLIVKNTIDNQTLPPATTASRPPEQSQASQTATAGTLVVSATKSGLEEIVGRNLISIIGIIITIIGVGIGAKYAIDNDLISPSMRIVSGYLFGIGLLGIAIWLKPKYLNFSAVLLSGALAILYFITYFAFEFYNLMPQSLAFVLMLLVTIGTVAAAINYSRQVIAQIGLVGAYAVPFLLSGDAGNESVLLGYVSVINFGVLSISLRKYWKSLFYSSFIFTWLIYATIFLFKFFAAPNFLPLMIFAVIFFLTFYTTFLAYKLIAKEQFGAENVFLLLVNSFVFYGFGYALIQNQTTGAQFVGLFTVVIAAFHLIVASLVKKYAFVDKTSVDFLAALGLIFATLAVPVQLSGHWVTLLWIAEAAVLFFFGRTRKLSLYENFAYPLMILALFSLLNDWNLIGLRNGVGFQMPFFNHEFLTGMLFVAGFTFVYFVNQKYLPATENVWRKLAKYLVPAILLAALYNVFRLEIALYFSNLSVSTAQLNADNSRLFDTDLSLFSFIWQLNYSMLFLSILLVTNNKKFKSNVLGFITLGISVLALLTFLTAGLSALGELRESYLAQSNAVFFSRNVFHLVIRYFSLAFVAALIFAGDKYIKESLNKRFPDLKLNLGFDFVFYSSILWLASSELLYWGRILRLSDADKLGLSVWWGIYALALVIVGIIKRKKHLRVGAIFLFAVTLVKLFFYDIATLGTISKTVVFVSLGILLLIISFLYNKYKNLIFGENTV